MVCGCALARVHTYGVMGKMRIMGGRGNNSAVYICLETGAHAEHIAKAPADDRTFIGLADTHPT